MRQNLAVALIVPQEVLTKQIVAYTLKLPRLFTLRATFKRFIFCVELHLTMLASPSKVRLESKPFKCC
ncbi:MAG: hypothetical protein U9N42_06610 [Campylobacterota bacterium]|nr:hypothetical protein [Campylobacterota bacterium]